MKEVKEEKLIVKEGYIIYDTEDGRYYDCYGDDGEIEKLEVCEDMTELMEEIESWDSPSSLQIKKVKFTYEILETFGRKVSYEPIEEEL
jgi:hypothetical protein